MAGWIKSNNCNIINNERDSVLCAEPGYGLVQIPVEERCFSLFPTLKTVSAAYSFYY